MIKVLQQVGFKRDPYPTKKVIMMMKVNIFCLAWVVCPYTPAHLTQILFKVFKKKVSILHFGHGYIYNHYTGWLQLIISVSVDDFLCSLIKTKHCGKLHSLHFHKWHKAFTCLKRHILHRPQQYNEFMRNGPCFSPDMQSLTLPLKIIKLCQRNELRRATGRGLIA